MTRTFVAIVNYRTADLTIACLQSLLSEVPQLGGGKVIVADNDSQDDSAARIAQAVLERGWSSWVEVLPQPRNGGFAYGNNACIAHIRQLGATPEFVLMLNPDTIVRPGLLRGLHDFMARHPRAGIAGVRIENVHGAVESSAHGMPTPMGEFLESARLGLLTKMFAQRRISPPPQPVAHACDWVSGACMLVRNQVFAQIGLLDERYFLYFEEVDFCRRASAAGWSVWYEPAVSVMHLEGASTGIQDVRKRRPAYWYASRRRFFAKAYGVPRLILADMMHLAGRTTYLLRKVLRLGASTRDDCSPRRFLWDMLFGDLRAVLRGELRNIRSQ